MHKTIAASNKNIILFVNPYSECSEWGFYVNMSLVLYTELWISKQSYLMFYQKDWWLTEPHKNCISEGNMHDCMLGYGLVL